MKALTLLTLVACGSPRVLKNVEADSKARAAAQTAVALNATPVSVSLAPVVNVAPAAPSTASVLPADVGAPVTVYFVRLDELRAYTSAQDPAQLLHATGQRFYPVLQAGRVTSSVSIALHADNHWHSEASGDVLEATAITALAAQLPAATAASHGLVQVPALGAEFLVHDEGRETFLTALFTVDGFTAGQALPLAQVIAQLSTAARAAGDDSFYD